MKKIALLLLNGCETMEFSPFIDVMGWDDIVGTKSITTDIYGSQNEITTSWGLKISCNSMIKDMDTNDYQALVVPGGFGKYGYFDNMKDQILKKIILDLYNKGKIIIGICTGALILGESGILKDKKATTYLGENNRYFAQLEKYEAVSIRQSMVTDENVWTCSGPSSAIDMAFRLLEYLTDKENLKTVKENMGFF